MNALLILFILAALGCVGYSILRYRKTPFFQYRYALSHQDLYIYEKGQMIFVTSHGASFTGECLWRGEEGRYVVEAIQLRLDNSTLDYREWSRNDFYEIEKKLYEKYPLAEINWDPPMRELMTI